MNSAVTPALSPFALWHSLRQHQALLRRLIARDVRSKYQGSVGGLLWSLLLPLLMLGVYLFVFGVVFSPRRGDAQAGLGAFGLSLFCGMLIHGLLAECLARAPAAVLAQPNYVKKVVFPLELLPLTVVGVAVVQYFIGLAVLLAAMVVMQGIPLSALALPLALLPLVVLCTGVSMGLAALSVYLRDIVQLTGILSTMLMFLSPVFYPVSALPEILQSGIYLNPLTLPIEAARAWLMGGEAPSWQAWAAYWAIALAVLAAGWTFFQATRRGFADVL